jgi:hypothetical protein
MSPEPRRDPHAFLGDITNPMFPRPPRATFPALHSVRSSQLYTLVKPNRHPITSRICLAPCRSRTHACTRNPSMNKNSRSFPRERFYPGVAVPPHPVHRSFLTAIDLANFGAPQDSPGIDRGKPSYALPAWGPLASGQPRPARHHPHPFLHCLHPVVGCPADQHPHKRQKPQQSSCKPGPGRRSYP